MCNFQDTFETRKRSFICDFSICMTVPLSLLLNEFLQSEMQKSRSVQNSTNIIAVANE